MAAAPALDSCALLIPADLIAKVIGKAGAGLKHVRETTGCKLDVKPSQGHGVPRRVELVGGSDSLAAGIPQILRRAFQDEAQWNFTMLVPTTRAGMLIGKGGENLKRVRENTGVRITVERDAVDGPGGAKERMAQIEGDQANVPTALTIAFGYTGSGSPIGALPMIKSGAYAAVAAAAAAPATVVPMRGSAGGGGGVVAVPTQVPRPCTGSTNNGQVTVTFVGRGNVSLSGVRPMHPDPEVSQVHLVIPDSLAFAFQGEVKNVLAASGCNLVTLTRKDGVSQRRIVMVGNYTQLNIAQGLLVEQLKQTIMESGENEPAEYSVYLFIRKDAAGAVIGKKGDTLKQIRETSGCSRLAMAREEIEGQRPANITGSWPCVLQAEEVICGIIQQNVQYSGGDMAAVPEYSNGFDGADEQSAQETEMQDMQEMQYDGGCYGPSGVYAGCGGGGCAGVAGCGGHYNTGITLPMHTMGQKRAAEDGTLGGEPSKRLRGSPEEQTKMLVPSRAAGAVIGKQGTGLKMLRESTGVFVEMQHQNEAPQWPGDRMLIIRGDVNDRLQAVASVLTTVFSETAESVVLKLVVPREMAGALIGKQAANLSKMREQTGVNVQVDREEVQGERLVTATGTRQQVTGAATMILAALDANKHHNTGGMISADDGAQMEPQAQRPGGGAGGGGFWHGGDVAGTNDGNFGYGL